MTTKYTMGVDVSLNTKKTDSPVKMTAVKSDSLATQEDSPFAITVLGNFSGRQTNDITSIAGRRLISVDRDNFEDVMSSFHIKLNITTGNNRQDQNRFEIKINELDDFHADELYENMDSFAELRSLRRRLRGHKTFDAAANEIMSWNISETNVLQKTEDNQPSQAELDIHKQNIPDGGSLLDGILDIQQGSADNKTTETHHIDRLIKNIVSPYVEPMADPRKEDMMEILDKATQAHMRDVLHSSEFQELESLWRSIYFLVCRLETGKKLKLYLLDISKQELAQDLAIDDLTKAATYKRFCDQTEGDMPWSIITGCYTFNDSIEDVLTLGAMGNVAQNSGACFLSAAHEKLAGCDSLIETPDYEDWNYTPAEGVVNAWEILRASPVSSYLGLALPRFLLRIPYGKKSKPLESFGFEEIADERSLQENHESYLWGNGAILKTELLARNFLKNSWQMQPGEIHEIEKLPLHYYNDEGETVNKPVAEIYLTEKAGEKITAQGLMPIWSVKNSDIIRSADFRSLNETNAKLSGRWVK